MEEGGGVSRVGAEADVAKVIFELAGLSSDAGLATETGREEEAKKFSAMAFAAAASAVLALSSSSQALTKSPIAKADAVEFLPSPSPSPSPRERIVDKLGFTDLTRSA